MITLKPHQISSFVTAYLPENPLIIEAGAYTGTETVRLAQQFPHSTIHSFEPVPELFAQLQKNCAPFAHINCHQKAISSTSGTELLHLSHKPATPHKISQANSLHAPKERLTRSPIQFDRTITVETISLDAWSAQEGVNTVDLLWLDTQGHEKSILEGAAKLLPTISVIMTEVGFIQAYEGQTPFDQLTDWLAQHNFTLVATDFTLPSDWFFGNAVYVNTQRMRV